jgi:hypothetical protein
LSPDVSLFDFLLFLVFLPLFELSGGGVVLRKSNHSEHEGHAEREAEDLFHRDISLVH